MGALLVACGSTGSSPAPVPQAGGPLAQSFDASAAANAVPRNLLVAIAQVEGGLTMPATRVVDPAAQVPVAGPMELRHGAFDSLARGAALMGASELALRQDTDTGLEAGARVLAELGSEHGAHGGDLASWKDAIEELSGFSDAAHREHYAHEVFALLASGGTFPGRDGESVTIAAHPELPPTLTLDVSDALHTLGKAEYPGAEWIPTSCTNKCDTTRGGATVQYVVIHDTEGGWNASVATLQNDPGKSVQYIVGQDGHVAQFVPESYTAWHAGNYWYNQRSVGIEHVGYYKQPYPEAQYASSAKLVGYLTGKYKVKKDRAHIIGHDQNPQRQRDGAELRALQQVPLLVRVGLQLRRRGQPPRPRHLGVVHVHAEVRRHLQVQRHLESVELLLGPHQGVPVYQRAGAARDVRRPRRVPVQAHRPERRLQPGAAAG